MMTKDSSFLCFLMKMPLKLEPFMLSGFQLFYEAYVILSPEQVPSALCQCRGIRLPGLHQKLRNQ